MEDAIFTYNFDSIPEQYYDDDIKQLLPDSCAIKSQQLILAANGISQTEEELIDIAKENGWYSEGGGTPKEFVGSLLESYGLPVTHYEHASIDDILHELQQGHQLIVGIDADEMLHHGLISELDDILHGPNPDHVLLLNGLDLSDASNPYVIMTDPGTGMADIRVPLDTFQDAWDDSGNFMVSA